MSVDLFGASVLEKRKNFSRNNLGQRRAGDFYQTPPSMTRQFLEALPVRQFPILEPAAGAGAMVKALAGEYSADRVDAYDIMGGRDFLDESRSFPTIITNPPFSLSTEFIIKCKMVATSRFSLLMPIDYLHGLERYRSIYSARDSWALAYVHIYTRRAMLAETVRDDDRYKTGMITWAWYTWTRRLPWSIEPRIRWIDNDAYVYRESGA